MERLCVRTNRVKNEQFPNKSWQLQLQLHHSRPGHCAFNVTQFPASKLTCVIQHPPYSPDLATAEYILFPKVKMVPKGERFSDISDMQCGVTELLKGVSLQDFSALSTTGINDLSVVSGVPRGGWGVQPPPPKFRRHSKIVPNSTRLWKLLKIAEFRTSTHKDVRKEKGSKILKLPRFAIVLH